MYFSSHISFGYQHRHTGRPRPTWLVSGRLCSAVTTASLTIQSCTPRQGLEVTAVGFGSQWCRFRRQPHHRCAVPTTPHVTWRQTPTTLSTPHMQQLPAARKSEVTCLLRQLPPGRCQACLHCRHHCLSCRSLKILEGLGSDPHHKQCWSQDAAAHTVNFDTTDTRNTALCVNTPKHHLPLHKW